MAEQERSKWSTERQPNWKRGTVAEQVLPNGTRLQYSPAELVKELALASAEAVRYFRELRDERQKSRRGDLDVRALARRVISDFWLNQVQRAALGALANTNLDSLMVLPPRESDYQTAARVLASAVHPPDTELKVAE